MRESRGGGPAAAPTKTLANPNWPDTSRTARACKAPDGLPVIPAFAVGRCPGGMVHACFWCGFCRGWHAHGVGRDELAWPGALRLGHCWTRSPLVAGYHVWVVGDLPRWCRRSDGTVKARLGPAKARRLAEVVP